MIKVNMEFSVSDICTMMQSFGEIEQRQSEQRLRREEQRINGEILRDMRDAIISEMRKAVIAELPRVVRAALPELVKNESRGNNPAAIAGPNNESGK